MSLIFATQLAAIAAALTVIATLGLLIGAIITARYAIKAYREQAREVAILTEQNQRDLAERRQAQAARIYAVAENHSPQYTHPYAINGSDIPVYDAQLWQSGPGILSEPASIGMLPPGGRGTDTRDTRYQDAVRYTVLTFRDPAGLRWIRMPDGTLEEQARGMTRASVLAALEQQRAAYLASNPDYEDRPGR